MRPDGPCSKCGHRTRAVHGVCTPCIKARVTGTHTDHALTGGQWVVRGSIKVWLSDDPPMTDAARKVAHCLFNQGDRDPEIVRGEKHYQRERKRSQRTARLATTQEDAA